MNKGEPCLVPEWLRSASSGGSSSSSSSSHSDSSASSLPHNTWNRNTRSKSDVDSRRGGSAKHPYSSFNFNRSQRDNKDRSRDKDRVDPWDLDMDQEQLRRSHSMVTRKNGGSSSSFKGNGIINGARSGFDKDFPSLGSEGVRVSSPGLSSVVQNLHSALLGGEGWTSALAEVPNVIIDKAYARPSLTSPKANVTLNMAEALVQAPPSPQQGSSVKTQRLEDLAIKQSRQLIPVVPSTPKSSILNSSDKSKTKPVVRAGDTCLAPSRNAQHQPSVQSNPIKSEKKLLVLKPAKENDVAAVKESASPSASNHLMNTAQSTQATPIRSPREHKGASSFTTEKKTSLAQTQSRNAFYSALKQKTTSTNILTHPVNSSISSFPEEKVNRSKGLVANDDPSSPQATSCLQVTQRSNIGFEAAYTPDEEEAKFLRSLGWDENYGEEEALTEEEIKAFRDQYQKLRPVTSA